MANTKAARKPTVQARKRRDNAPARNDGLWIRGGFDVPFFMIVIALVVLGLIMMFSASYSYCYYYFGDSLYYFKRQLTFAILGLGIMALVSRLNVKFWKKVATPLLLVTGVLLVVVLFVTPAAGFEEFHRWINLGPVSFQPSEIAKFSIILYFAYHMDKHYKEISGNALWRENGRIYARTVWLFFYLAILAVTCLLVYKENHVSGTLLIFALGVMMLFLAGYNWKWFAVIAGVLVVAVIVVVTNPTILPEHAQPRILAWVDKSYDPLGVRWQTNQAIYAIGSGGFFGVGIGNSKMKQLYVSEPQNDFIFSIICEELGFLGALMIVILFGLLVWRGFKIGIQARDRFGGWMAMGIVFQVGLQAALNIGVVTDVLPNTGISLPFFSYGGTSLMMLIFEMGIVLSVSRTAKLEKV